MVGKTVGEQLAEQEDALEAREAAKRAVYPQKFLAELRRKLGPDLERRLKVEPNKTCACGSCPVCYYRYAQLVLATAASVRFGLEQFIVPEHEEQAEVVQAMIECLDAAMNLVSDEREAWEKSMIDGMLMASAIKSGPN